MNGLTKLGTILTVVFIVSLLALVAELLYVLWRRQNFRRRSDPFYRTPSKEQLLYFFCWKNQSRVEPAGNPQVPASEDLEAASAAAVVDDDVAKWQLGVNGPSRFLFTIKEEDREGTETETENDQAMKSSSKTVCIEAAESSASDEDVVVVTIEAVDEGTPFSTPCASPPYYTPSPSPTHDKFSPGNGEDLIVSKGENDSSFVSLEVCSE